MINSVGAEPPKYKDPLNKNIFVVMSYSNEVGTAIAEIAPKLGAALWAPTFMYLGADIYDKYKNDKDSFDPSPTRALKRIIFQALTSLIALPGLIYLSQSLVSPLGKLGKNKISGNTKEQIFAHIKNIIQHTHTVNINNKKSFVNEVTSSLRNKITTREIEYHKINPIKKIYHKLFTNRYALLNCDRKNLFEFAKQNTQEAFDMMENLRQNNRQKVPSKIYKEYKKSLSIHKETYKSNDYAHLAIRDALEKYQASLIFKNKLVKTCVGLGATLLFAKPVNDLVEKHIMKKYVKPGIDNLSIRVANSHYTVKHSKIYMMIKGKA